MGPARDSQAPRLERRPTDWIFCRRAFECIDDIFSALCHPGPPQRCARPHYQTIRSRPHSSCLQPAAPQPAHPYEGHATAGASTSTLQRAGVLPRICLSRPGVPVLGDVRSGEALTDSVKFVKQGKVKRTCCSQTPLLQTSRCCIGSGVHVAPRG